MKKIKINIGTKIMGMVGVLLLLMAFSAGYGIFKIGHVGEELKAIAEENIPLTEAITEVTINQLEQAIWFSRSIRMAEWQKHLKFHHPDPDDTKHGVIAEVDKKLDHSIAAFDEHSQLVDKHIQHGEEIAAHAISVAINEAMLNEFQGSLDHLNKIRKQHGAYEHHAHQVFELLREAKTVEATELAAKVEAEEEKLDHELESFLKQVETFTHASASQAQKDEHAALTGMLLITLAALIVGLAMGFLLTRAITRPIKKAVVIAKAMADGDLTQTLAVNQKDEIGMLAGALNQMSISLRSMFKQTTEGIGTLTTSSTELSAISAQMAAGSEQTSGKADQVATAAEAMSTNMDSVAAASEQASTNVQMVAAASEQMSATIDEIAGNTEKGRTITAEAVDRAKSVSTRVAELGEAATDVGNVTETINEISEQTNLLALNATIEAARAGEAGKGFAVVANEIKELAKQTATATQDIRLKIEGIQGSTAGAVTEIKQIESVITNINDIVGTIATAVDEQSAATKEIAGNVNQAAQGIQDVNENVAQSSSVSTTIAKEVVEVNDAAKEMADGSQQLNQSAGELSQLAEQLKSMVDRFRL